jgi:hypothetical protein
MPVWRSQASIIVPIQAILASHVCTLGGHSISFKGLYSSQMNLQWTLFPHQKVSLFDPITSLICDLQIKVEDNQSKNQPHFAICKTRAELLGCDLGFMGVATYFLPRQFRGPVWNGCNVSRRSSANEASPKNLSG